MQTTATRYIEPTANTLRAGFGALPGFAQMLDFTVSAGGTEDAAATLRAVGRAMWYNNFRPEALAKALEAIREMHPSGFQLDVMLGREGSPVCYVQIPYFADGGHKLTDEERAALIASMMDALRRIAKPDELTTEDNYFDHKPSKIRAWWD